MSHAAATTSAAVAGSSPDAACAAASAASTSSRATIQARRDVSGPTGPVAVRNVNGSSDGEEDGLIGTLQPDVEAVGARLLERRDQRAGPRADAAQHGIGVVRRLALEVGPRHEAVEE